MKIYKDYSGCDVRLTDERLQHILEHPEMADLVPAIEETLSQPRIVIRSLTDPNAELNYRFYFNTCVGDKWLCVVVKHSSGGAFILTAYLTDKIKKGIQLWPKK
ncbi:hypothetical protein L0Z72_15620 [candidate division KSB1 bacterium]|nr:hypothetical protein [candidate division KSB1 bacterium]